MIMGPKSLPLSSKPPTSSSSSSLLSPLSTSLLATAAPDACRPPRLAAPAKRSGFKLLWRVGVAMVPNGCQTQLNFAAMAFFVDLKK